jgi:cytoskeletal protein CcmA (bactofilin family)
MALFGRDEKDPREVKVDRFQPVASSDAKLAVAPPQPRKDPPIIERDRSELTDTGEVNAYLGKGSRVSGKLTFDGTVRVDGQVEGEIAAENTLIVGETAVVTAQISGNTIVIKGKVTGDINARSRVEIRAPGRLYGDIVTPSLVIHDGVIFEGRCSMGGSEARSSDRKVVTPFPKEEKGDGLLVKGHSEASR